MTTAAALRRFARRHPLTAGEVLLSLVVLVGTGVVMAASFLRPAGVPDPSGPPLLAVLLGSVLLPGLVAVDLFASGVDAVRSGFAPSSSGLGLAGYLLARGAEALLSLAALAVIGFGVILVSLSDPGPKPGGGLLHAVLFVAVLVSLMLAAVVLVRVAGCRLRSAL